MIVRQTEFPTPVLRQTPSGLDRISASAVRGGYVRIASGGLLWLPLGSRLIDRVRSVLTDRRAAPKFTAGFSPASSPMVEWLKAGQWSPRTLPPLVHAQWAPSGTASHGLTDEFGLGVLEWAGVGADLRQAAATLAEVEGRLREVFRRSGVTAEAANGGPGEDLWVRFDDEGPKSFLQCGHCGYTAEAEQAAFKLGHTAEDPLAAMQEVPTPGATTIRSLCDQLGIEPSGTLKALFLTTAEGETLLALLRGDLEASLPKLRTRLATVDLNPAPAEAVGRLAVVPGYAGPVGLTVRPTRESPGVWVVADPSAVASRNLVTGANREGFHLTGVNFPRDYKVTEVVDFARAPAGARCAGCGGALEARKAFILARRRSFDGCFSYVAAGGENAPGAVISLQFSVGAVTSAILSAARQPDGMRFPATWAAFPVHLIDLQGGLPLEPLLEQLNELDLDVLVDDRDLSAGVKFAEADWIGAPVRLVSGRKSAEAGGVELRAGPGVARIFPIDEAARALEAVVREVM